MKENKKAKRKRILNSKKEKLLKMYYSGLSETYICERYRIPPSTFSGWIKEYRPYQRGSKFTSDETVNRNLTEKLRKEEAMLCIMSDFIKYLDSSDISNIVCMPKTGHDIAKKLKNKKTFIVNTLEEAVDISKKVTGKNMSCLLSPAAASYGFFKNFEEKGDLFQKLVKQ